MSGHGALGAFALEVRERREGGGRRKRMQKKKAPRRGYITHTHIYNNFGGSLLTLVTHSRLSLGGKVSCAATRRG